MNKKASRSNEILKRTFLIGWVKTTRLRTNILDIVVRIAQTFALRLDIFLAQWTARKSLKKSRRLQELWKTSQPWQNAAQTSDQSLTLTHLRTSYFPLKGNISTWVETWTTKKSRSRETTKINGDISERLVDKINCHDDRYKEILGDRRVENETKNTNKRWDNNGLKDTSVYHEDQKNGYARYSYGYNRIYDKDDMSPLKINLRLDTPSDSQQKEINRLRVQIEKLSTFVESSDERREQAEILLGQQKEELLKQIREKEVLDNRVCCLEELRRNLQRKINEISEENKSIKLALKSNEEKLSEEKERVSVLKKECSNEIAKNVELELVLQTIREELGCVTPPNNRYLSDLSLGTRQSGDDVERDCDESRVGGFAHAGAKHGEKKVTWGQLPVHSHEIKSACCSPELFFKRGPAAPKPGLKNTLKQFRKPKRERSRPRKHSTPAWSNKVTRKRSGNERRSSLKARFCCLKWTRRSYALRSSCWKRKFSSRRALGRIYEKIMKFWNFVFLNWSTSCWTRQKRNMFRFLWSSLYCTLCRNLNYTIRLWVHRD